MSAKLRDANQLKPVSVHLYPHLAQLIIKNFQTHSVTPKTLMCDRVSMMSGKSKKNLFVEEKLDPPQTDYNYAALAN